MEQKMFCYQCQETAGCKGCTMSGVCGKKPDVAAMQDLLVYVTKGISAVTTALRQEGKQVSAEINHLITLNLFTTITNANFDKESIEARIRATLTEKDVLLAQIADPSGLPEAAKWNGSGNWEEKAATVGVLSTENEDIRSLRELITYGLKGLSAYSKHANVLLKDDEEVDAFLQRALAATLDDNLSVEELIALTMETGKHGVSGMALLDKANTEAYGNPEITKVNIGVGTNPGILVSGHDLRDLEMLLEQTQGTGVDVYTHSEMLPAHYYPAFKKYPNFIGNYGNAWWKQKEEFESFNGPILMTTNCIVPPKDSYKEMCIRDREEYNSRCINCGRCNFVCPTCTCFTMQDLFYSENGKVGERRRIWASCMVDGFTDVAGGGSYRKKNGERMRFKLLHKVLDYKQRNGYHMCVGCGRCDDICPEYISFSGCINKLQSAMTEVTEQ